MRPAPLAIRHPLSDQELSRYIIRHNIEHYRKLAIETADPAKRAVINKLLAEEEAKLVEPGRAEHNRGVVT